MKKVSPFILPLLRSVLFIASGLLLPAVLHCTLEEAGRWWPVMCTFLNILTVAVLWLVCKAEGTTYRELIVSAKGRSSIKETVLVVLVMLVLGMGGMTGFGFLIYGYVPSSLVQPIPVWMAAVNLILFPLTVVFAEMPLYYGYALQRLETATHNKFLAVAYPIFFYALQHSFFPLYWDVKHILFRFLSYLPLMLVLGVWYYKKRNLVPMMIGHGILDLATGVQILMLSVLPAAIK